MGRPADVFAGFDLFAVTPGRGDGDEIVAALPRLAARGVRRLLLREKASAPRLRRLLAERLAPLCRARAMALWISEDVELALAVGAAGVQLSEQSPSPLVIRARAGLPDGFGVGVSLHRPLARSRGEIEVCDHAFLGPLLATPSKPEAVPLGVEAWRALAATIPIPVFAIGGINAAALPELAAAGIRKIAAIRLFFGVQRGQ